MPVRYLAFLLVLFTTVGVIAPNNVILISVDTLRGDRLSCYGYGKNETKNIDRLAREGYLFERAYSEYPLTLPAHSSMLTGTLPFQHGVRENVGFRLDESKQTLAEILKARGYRTAGFVGSYVMGAEFGLAQGFDFYDDNFPVSLESVLSATAIQRPASEVMQRFFNWMEAERPNKFFAFIHFYDPHTPRPLGYDHEVSQVDRSVGDLYRFLSENGLLQNSHLILTSDHGEGLGEHGESGHGFFLYDSTMRVPLIIRAAGPAGARVRIGTLVSLADIVPTVLDLLGLATPSEVQGRSLVPLLKGNRSLAGPVYAESHIPNLHFGWAQLRSIRDDRYKYIDAPDPELYDVNQDPRELKNLYPEATSIGSEYRKLLESFVRGRFDQDSMSDPEIGVDAEILERLAALGYVRPNAGRRESLLDPKERIGAFEEYYSILELLPTKQVPRGTLGRIDQLETQAPEISGLPFLRAWTYEILGEVEKALETYPIALKKDSTNHLARGRYARLLIRQGKFEDAEEQFKILLRLAPNDYRTRNNLAGLYHMTGKPSEAIAELEKVTSLRPRYAAAWQNLGRLYLEAGNYIAAENSFRRLVELTSANPAVHLLLAEALKRQGRRQEAEQEEARARRLRSGSPP